MTEIICGWVSCRHNTHDKPVAVKGEIGKCRLNEVTLYWQEGCDENECEGHCCEKPKDESMVCKNFKW